MLLLLIAGRRDFTARPDPRSAGTVLLTALSGVVLATGVGWAFLTVTAFHEAPGTSALERLQQALGGRVEAAHPLVSLRVGKIGLSETQLVDIEPVLAVPVGLALGLLR